MGLLADRAFSERALREARAAVVKRDGEDGQLTRGTTRFAEHLDEQLIRLQADLALGSLPARGPGGGPTGGP